eukprot:2637340-Rhodomonas_salina.1
MLEDAVTPSLRMYPSSICAVSRLAMLRCLIFSMQSASTALYSAFPGSAKTASLRSLLASSRVGIASFALPLTKNAAALDRSRRIACEARPMAIANALD